MSDDKNKKGYQDRTRINLSEYHEVQYWTKKFGVDRAMLEKYVKEVGPMITDVEKLIKGKS